MAEWQAPGSVLVIVEDGKLVHCVGYGIADLDSRRFVDPDSTIFRLGSISKPVTALVAALVAETGRLDLEWPIARYLENRYPELVERLKTDVGGPELTTEHLLTHTGGFEDRFLTRMHESLGPMSDLGSFLSRQMPTRLYPAGEVSLYSNHGVALAGLVAAEAAGRPFVDLANDELFEPLGMRRSGFLLQERLESDLAQGYRRGGPVVPAGIRTVPASMFFSTATDMAKLMLELVSGQGGLLSPSLTSDVFEHRFGHHPSHPGRALGWVADSAVSPRRLFHSGGVEGFSSGIVLVPELRGGVFVAMNGNAWVWGLLQEILDDRFPATSGPATSLDAAGSSSSDEPGGDPAGRWAPAELPRTTFDRARVLFDQTVVERAGRSVRFESESFDPVGDGSLRSESGSVIVFREATGNRPAFLLTPSGAYRRLAWHEGWPLHLGLLVAFASGFVAVILDRPFRLRGPSVARGRRLAARWLFTSAFLNLVFLIALGALMSMTLAHDGGVLRFRIPWYVIAILGLPLAGAGSTVMAGLSLLRGERGQTSCEPRLVAAVALCLSFLPFVAYWNLLGFHF